MSDTAVTDPWTTDPWSTSPSADTDPEPGASATVEPEPATPKTPRRRRPAAPRPAGARRGRGKEARVDPRRVVNRAFDVIALSGEEQSILAAAVGAGADDLPEVVLESLARQEQAAAAGQLIAAVAGAEPLAAGALAVGAAADGGLAAAWPILAGLADLGVRPDRAVDAGMVFAAAAQQLDADTLGRVEAVLSVLAG